MRLVINGSIFEGTRSSCRQLMITLLEMKHIQQSYLVPETGKYDYDRAPTETVVPLEVRIYSNINNEEEMPF